jgi:hypothetical protein
MSVPLLLQPRNILRLDRSSGGRSRRVGEIIDEMTIMRHDAADDDHEGKRHSTDRMHQQMTSDSSNRVCCLGYARRTLL